MSAMKASDVYHEHVQALPVAERLKLLSLIADDLVQEVDECRDHPRHNLMELHGLGKELWEGIDAQEYVNRLRSEWDKPLP